MSIMMMMVIMYLGSFPKNVLLYIICEIVFKDTAFSYTFNRTLTTAVIFFVEL